MTRTINVYGDGVMYMFHIQYICTTYCAYELKSTVPRHSSITRVTLCLQFITLRSIPLIYKISFFCLGAAIKSPLTTMCQREDYIWSTAGFPGTHLKSAYFLFCTDYCNNVFRPSLQFA